MRVHLVRHPEPVGAAGVCYGRADLPVTEDAVAAVADRLALETTTRCISSPLVRCLALARVLSDDVVVDPRLVEMDFGEWDGRRWDDIDRAEFDRWAADYVNRKVPGGESWLDLQHRVKSFLDDARAADSDDLLVVTHAGVIRAVIALVLGIDLERTWRIEVPFGCVVEIEPGADEGADRLVGIRPLREL